MKLDGIGESSDRHLQHGGHSRKAGSFSTSQVGFDTLTSLPCDLILAEKLAEP